MSSLAIGLIIGAFLLAISETISNIRNMTDMNNKYSTDIKGGKVKTDKKVQTEKYEHNTEKKELITEGFYITKGGETLEAIAKEVYGCRECWLIIYDMNKEKLKKNPWKRLERGIRLRYKLALSEFEKKKLKERYLNWLRRISTGKTIPE